MGLTPVRAGDLAAVVTALEMTQRPPLRPLPESRLRLTPWREPAGDKYRALFRRVGGPWLWYSRLAMSDRELARITGDAAVEVYAAVDPAGIEVGMLELDFRTTGTCLIAYFGLVPELVGQGHGRWLMAQAQARGWRADVVRMTVNTCTLDHPRALGFYLSSGFAATRRVLETFPDPRLLGLLPPEAGAHVPLIGASSRR
jgi:GNAT superfamily N-acetyltransferase